MQKDWVVQLNCINFLTIDHLFHLYLIYTSFNSLLHFIQQQLLQFRWTVECNCDNIFIWWNENVISNEDLSEAFIECTLCTNTHTDILTNELFMTAFCDITVIINFWQWKCHFQKFFIIAYYFYHIIISYQNFIIIIYQVYFAYGCTKVLADLLTNYSWIPSL